MLVFHYFVLSIAEVKEKICWYFIACSEDKKKRFSKAYTLCYDLTASIDFFSLITYLFKGHTSKDSFFLIYEAKDFVKGR